jgi:hypothetical protein
MKHMGVDFQSAFKMPVYLRRLFLRFLNDDFEEQTEEYEKIKNQRQNKRK